MFLLNFFKTGPDKPVLEDQNKIRRIFEKKRKSVFFGLLFGYSYFYVCRLTLSVAKKPMIDSGIINSEQLGTIGFCFFMVYAFGKLFSGFLADRSNIGRFMSTGLMVSAILLVLFGFSKSFLVFAILWGINGLFQSMGSAPSGASLSQWFSNKERGTRYGIWSCAHPIGEGISMVTTAIIISYTGWQWGFWAAGGISILVALIMYRVLADRPRTYGLPTVADYKDDHTTETKEPDVSVNRAQFEVIKNPYIWILGLASAALYIARYGINSWGPMYLQESKDYTLITAGLVLGWAKSVELLGALSSGFVSDYFFKSRRNGAVLVYGLILIAGMITLFKGPSTHIHDLDLSFKQHLTVGPVHENIHQQFLDEQITLPAQAHIESFDQKDNDRKIWLVKNDRWYKFWTGYCLEETPTQLKVTAKFHPTHLAGIAMFGFGMGGLLVLVCGLMTIDICSKQAKGAGLGLVGVFSYLGAAVQERVSGGMIEAGKMTVDGRVIHDFRSAFLFWLGAAIVAIVLTTSLWKVKAKE